MTRAEKNQPVTQRTDREILEEAARHLRSNALAKALPLYQQLYDQEPNDWTVANALGDLHVRMNATDLALGVFMDLAEHMAGEGHAIKARALYRKVLRLRPGNAAATTRVAELENEHLDASPIMQRVRGALLDARVAAPQSEPAPDEPAFETAAREEPAVETAAREEPAVETAAREEPAVETAAREEPAVEMAARGEPAFETAAREEPAPPPAPSPALTVTPAPEPELRPAPVALDSFEPVCDKWIAVGRALASAPLHDRPSNTLSPARLDAFQRMEASARGAAASGDYRGAFGSVEHFLRGYPHDVEALALLVEFRIDGGLGNVAASQIRLAEACIATGRVSSARHVALDLLRRQPDDLAVGELADRIFVAGGIAPPAPQFEAPPVIPLDDDDVGAGAGELFDDDGLVTAEAPRRAPASASARPQGADPLDDWLDAADESDARDAVVTAARHAAAGNVAAAKAMLEPLMRTPALRPIAGVGLAQLYRRELDYARALQCLEQAAEQPSMDEDTAHALAYELALTLEAAGQRNDALALYQELLSEVGPAFRDVAARAQQLSAA
jgi:tetratricopeptide (TPR) repeat protein